MSLARTLMNGGLVNNFSSINPARYGHEQGASVIAMESVEELHEIFLESYNFEQADLAAAIEGVALEGSQYEAVAEAAIGGMFAKIKNFFVKLKEKVLAFFHSVKRYLDSLFMSGKDFAKKYAKEINKLNDIKDLEVKMFNYNDGVINDVPKVDVDGLIEENLEAVKKYIDKAKDLKSGDEVAGQKKKIAEEIDAQVEALRADNIDDEIVSQLTDGKCKSADDYAEYLFGYFRNGAKDASDKEDRDLTKSDIDGFVKALEESDSKGLSKYESDMNKVYTKAIKAIDDAEKKFNGAKGEGASRIAKLLSAYSSFTAKGQSFQNTLVNAWKAAAKERDAAYKSAIMAAFSNNSKNAKKKN